MILSDISAIPLGHVRSSLGIIAQDPVLLSGSLRLNLDIEGRYTDKELYDALHQVQLIKRVETLDSSRTSSSVTAVEADLLDPLSQTNIFNNLDSEIKCGGEKSVRCP